MNIQKLKYQIHSGKNSKPWYYIKEYARLYTPACILIWRGQRLLAKAKKRKDYDYILSRVNYYNKLTENYLHLICCVVNYVGFTSEKLIHKGFF